MKLDIFVLVFCMRHWTVSCVIYLRQDYSPKDGFTDGLRLKAPDAMNNTLGVDYKCDFSN